MDKIIRDEVIDVKETNFNKKIQSVKCKVFKFYLPFYQSPLRY